MPYYAYILQSELDETYYKGYTEQPLIRLQQHNTGEMAYTSRKVPWRLVGLIIFETKREALIAERKLKKYGKDRIDSFLVSDRNQLKDFLGSLP